MAKKPNVSEFMLICCDGDNCNMYGVCVLVFLKELQRMVDCSGRLIQSSILNVYCNAHVSGIALLTNIIATLCIACHRMQLVIAYVCV
ncbi:unnamed protein product [Cylicocyclus nassatus]|uniref:Uncharacterized protein n=1 Tax=Cylicocyclus nassatus TaxID=53992 RepID=A0AA36DRN5_CYLNA|nr:unnamed protein product [Cylicocyclus nassatus]